MKKVVLSLLAFFLPFTLSAAEEDLNNQMERCLGATYCIICQAMTIAQDHGYPYVKILSYDFNSGNERLCFSDATDYPTEAERFEFVEEDGKMEVVCFRENTNQCVCICIEDYSEVIDAFRRFEAPQ